MLNILTKKKHMNQLAVYRQGLLQKPQLRHLFLELTMRCNEHCLHCGSRCGDTSAEELTAAQYHSFLSQVKEDFGVQDFMLCITGGEPLLREDFFPILSDAKAMGFQWGMTTNATLIDDTVARDLRKSGMKTISVSIDGLEATHDAFRQTPGGYQNAMRGLESLIRVGGFQNIQVTTVVTHENIDQLDELFAIFNDMDLDSWRVINIEPIGRALQHPELMLTREDYVRMFEFIRQKRMLGEPVSYGCSHYLGLEYEREVRDWFFLCTAGIYTASIMCNGDITACLDIERRPEFIQGNILRDRFRDVWLQKFQPFRRDLCDKNEACTQCSEVGFCHGGAFHTWNFDENKPIVCFKDILF